MQTSHADGAYQIELARRNGGFLHEHQVKMIAADDRTRLELLLVRCGSGRFLTPAQDVAHFIEIIERDGRDYVRDVSIPVNAAPIAPAFATRGYGR